MIYWCEITSEEGAEKESDCFRHEEKIEMMIVWFDAIDWGKITAYVIVKAMNADVQKE